MVFYFTWMIKTVKTNCSSNFYPSLMSCNGSNSNFQHLHPYNASFEHLKLIILTTTRHSVTIWRPHLYRPAQEARYLPEAFTRAFLSQTEIIKFSTINFFQEIHFHIRYSYNWLIIIRMPRVLKRREYLTIQVLASEPPNRVNSSHQDGN